MKWKLKRGWRTSERWIDGVLWREELSSTRVWGSVPRSSLIGPVILSYWPLNRIGRHY